MKILQGFLYTIGSTTHSSPFNSLDHGAYIVHGDKHSSEQIVWNRNNGAANLLNHPGLPCQHTFWESVLKRQMTVYFYFEHCEETGKE